MKSVIGIGLLVLLVCKPKVEVDQEKMLAESKRVMQKMMATMIGKLAQVSQEKGFAHAVSYCKAFVPKAMAKNKGEWDLVAQRLGFSGLLVKRISLKNRNPNNAPKTKEEREVLLQWEASGDPKPVIRSVQKGWKVLLPIRVISPMCLQCHGPLDRIDPKVKEKIHSLYPNDKATGYRLGDLRGAFVLTFLR